MHWYISNSEDGMLATLAVPHGCESRSMDRSSILKSVLFLVFLVLQPGAKSQWLPTRPIAPRPLCGSQFALVNHACALLPYVPGPPPSPPSPPPSPPTPPSPPSPGGRDHRGHRHRHRQRRHRHNETPIEADCCKWLAEVDSECVCDLLVHLPPFLSRPVHQYTVGVGELCNVTYYCGSRIHI